MHTDRIEITSAGILPEGLSEEEFFDGVSFPRNRELMRIYRDLELVEQLGSGVPRILDSYDKECFKFLDNFTRITFPISKASGRYVRLVDGLIESQQQIIRLIQANPRISKKSMGQHIGISTTAIDKHIRSLGENKVIARTSLYQFSL